MSCNLLTNSVLASIAGDLRVFCAGFLTELYSFLEYSSPDRIVHKIRRPDRIRQRIAVSGKRGKLHLHIIELIRELLKTPAEAHMKKLISLGVVTLLIGMATTMSRAVRTAWK